MAIDGVASTTGPEPAEKAPNVAPADLRGDRWPPDEEKSEPRWSDPRLIWLTYSRVAASAIAHVLVILWIAGLFATAQENLQIEAVPVELVAADDAPPPLPAAPVVDKPVAAKPAPKPDSGAEPSPEPLPKDQPPGADAQRPPDQPAASTKPQGGPGMAGDDRPTTLTQEERNALIAQVRRCWKIPAGWTDPRQVSATVRFRLNRDGTLEGTPVVVEFHASLLGKAAADDAVRALKQCGPYQMPADKYAEWSDVQMRFVP